MAPLPSSAPKAGWLYDLILLIFGPLLDLFFREIQVRGSWRVPSQGAIILVAAPHANQFVDSLVLMRIMRSLNRRVSWLMAAKSFDKPIIGPLATLAGAVPVARAMDYTKSASGTIHIQDPIGNPRLLSGNETRFDTPEFEVGGSLYLPPINGESHRLDIAEIQGPEEILLKAAPSDKGALDQLSNLAGSAFKVAPHIDQAAVYNAVFDQLRKSRCIGIFPEGGSHDRSDLLPLKAGISIIALGALAQDINVTVVPVGLNYFHAHKFRSRAVVEFGDPVSISPQIVQDFKNGKKRESVGFTLGSIFQALTAVTVAAPDFETLQLVHATRRLYIPRSQCVPLSTVVEINRRLIKGYTQYRNDPKIASLSKAIGHYNRRLQLLGLRDHQVEYARISVLRVMSTLLYRLVKLGILAIGTLPGLALFSPVFVVARIYSHRKTKEALAASSVKIRGNDVMATWKILVAGCLAPLLYIYYALILTFWTQYNRINGFMPKYVPIWTITLGGFILFPTITYAALRLGEVGMDILKSIKPLVLCLSPSSAGTLAQLREDRSYLAGQVAELVNTLGPDLFPDCDAAKLPQPRKLYSEVSPEASLDDLESSEFF